MNKISLNLPRYRLDFSLVKRRASDIEPLFPSFSEIKRVRSGNRLSRYFRYLFEHKNLKRILGGNLAFMFIATSLLSGQATLNTEAETMVISSQIGPLETIKGVQYPLENTKINQGYRAFHPGLDLDGETGDPVKPIEAGKVEAISTSKYAYGKAVIVDHGNQMTSLYAHLSEIDVKEGEEVTTETVIGEVGSTGHSTGSHLHLEIRDHGTPVNPFQILPLPTVK